MCLILRNLPLIVGCCLEFYPQIAHVGELLSSARVQANLRWLKCDVVFDFEQNALRSCEVKQLITIAKKTQHIALVVELNELLRSDTVLTDIKV